MTEESSAKGTPRSRAPRSALAILIVAVVTFFFLLPP